MATQLRPLQVVALASSVALLSAFVAYRVWSADRRMTVVADTNAGVGLPSTETFVGTDPALISQGRSTPHPVTTKRGTMVEPKDVDDPAMFWGSKSGRILTPLPPGAEQPTATPPHTMLMPSSKDMILVAPGDLHSTPPAAPTPRTPPKRMFSSSKSGAIVEPEDEPPVMLSGSKSGYIWDERTAKAFGDMNLFTPTPSEPPPRLIFNDTHMSSSKLGIIMTPDDAVFNLITRRPAPPEPGWNPVMAPEKHPLFWTSTFWWWRPQGTWKGNEWWLEVIDSDEPATSEPGK